jgi:hypothetical protein
MTNIDKASAALSEWAFNIVANVMPSYTIPPGSRLGGVMQTVFGIDPTKYNVWKELGFLAEPMIQTMVTPAVRRMLEGMPDEQVPEIAEKFVDAFRKQAQEKGGVNLFGLDVGPKAFDALKEILAKKMEE